MKTRNLLNGVAGTSILTAIAASLCCITPVLALIAGGSGLAASFSWIEPARPYLIGISVIVLGFAWYQKLKPVKQAPIECDCEGEKPSFWQSKKFLAIVTLFAVLMMAFPSYSHIFYPENKNKTVVVDDDMIRTLHLDISGMTCESCNLHLEHTAQKYDGVLKADADYKTGSLDLTINTDKTSIEKIINGINKTGYKVVAIKTDSNGN